MAALINKCESPFFPPKQSLQPPPPSRLFEETLALRLRSLLPIPDHPSEVPLTWLARAVRIPALALAGAAALFSDSSLPGGLDPDVLTAHLDAGVPFLDACNVVSAEISRLERRLLPVRVAIRLLSFSDEDDDDDPRSPTKDKIRWARKAIAERDATPSREIGCSAGELIRRMAPGDPPRGGASAVRRATYAVEAVSRLVMAAVLAVLDGEEGKDLVGEIRVSREWPWAEAFNEVAAAVSDRLGASLPGELEAVEAAVRRLAGAIDGEESGDGMEGLGVAAAAVERATVELTAGLDSLTESVNGAFHAAMGARNAALNSLRSRRRRCT